MPFSGFYVCPECKPLAVAKLARGEAIGGFWRDRNGLVIAVGRLLPDRCVRCNDNSEGYRVKRNMYWHNPAIYLSLFLSPIIYLLIAILARKKATVDVPLCPEHRRQRTSRIWASAGVGVAAVIGIVGIITYVSNTDVAIWLGITAGIVVLGAILTGVSCGRIVEPKRITATHIFLKGAREPFLATLPAWPRE